MANNFRNHWLVVCLVPLAVALAGDSTGPYKGKPRTDIHGDPLPPGAQARIGTTRLRHARSISALVYSRDGKVLAVGSGDGAVCLWEAATGKLLRRLKGHKDDVFAIALSADGKKVATASADKTVRIWDAATGQQLWQGSQKEWVLCVAFSPDDATVASGGGDNHVRLWDTATGKELRQFADPTIPADQVIDKNVYAVAFSPDGLMLASSGQNHAIHLWEVKSGKKMAELRSKPAAKVHGLAFSQDGKLLASAHGERASVHLWNVVKKSVALRLEDACQGLKVAFSSDGQRLAVGPIGFGRRSHILEVGTWRITHRLDLGQNWPFTVALLPDGTVLLAAAPVALSPDGNVLATAEWAGISLQSLSPDKGHLPLLGTSGVVRQIALSPDGKVLAAATADGVVRLHGTTTGRVVRSFPERYLASAGLHFSLDGKRLIMVDAGGKSRWVNAVTGKTLVATVEEGLPGGSSALSRDGRTLVFQSRDDFGVFHVWNLIRGKKTRVIDQSMTDGEHLVKSFALSPDGRLLALETADPAGGQHIELWGTATGKKVRHWAADKYCPMTGHLTFSADGHSLAGGNEDGEVLVWETATGGLRCRLAGKNRSVRSVAFSPDGRTLALGGRRDPIQTPLGTDPIQSFLEGPIELWDLATNQQRWQLAGHGDPYYALAFSEDGKTLASLSWDGTALLWPIPACPKRPVVLLKPTQLQSAWANLASADAAKAYAALWQLTTAPQAVAFLKERLPPVMPAEPAVVTQFLKALESNKFQVRQQAANDLRKLGAAGEPLLRQLLAAKPPLEVQRRIEPLLALLEVRELSPEHLRSVRVLEVLERIDSPAARKMLQTLADGAPGVWLTTQAQRALERLGWRRGGTDGQ